MWGRQQVWCCACCRAVFCCECNASIGRTTQQQVVLLCKSQTSHVEVNARCCVAVSGCRSCAELVSVLGAGSGVNRPRSVALQHHKLHTGGKCKCHIQCGVHTHWSQQEFSSVGVHHCFNTLPTANPQTQDCHSSGIPFDHS